jgi:undecaprenyl-diphosphatase
MAAIALLAAIPVVASMMFVDAWAVAHAVRLPLALRVAADRFTDLGKSGWFLWPVGLALLGLAAIDAPGVPRVARQVLAAWAVRLSFVFSAIALPSLLVTVGKRLIGRARPLVDGVDVWSYHPLSWQPKFASLPSGHATSVFAALVAISSVCPQARPLLWIYAIGIGISRIIVTTHFPSDILAGAIVGAAGAMVVRHWFAVRGLAFTVTTEGQPYAMPGPSVSRITKAVAACLRRA